MRTRNVAIATVLSLILFAAAVETRADTLVFKNGSTIEGVIRKVEAGTVYVQIENEEKGFSILDIETMDFNTPHVLLPEAANIPLEHFLKDIESQEIVRNVEQLEKASADLIHKLGQIRNYWGAKDPIAAEERDGWETAKEEFRKPLALYQELLNDLYFHVLAKVDEYNLIAREARKVYVGIKGIRFGSALVSKEMEKLPLKKYVPSTWYDTIFYDGYNLGYDEAYMKYKESGSSGQ
jgi:hypothetical protein